MTTPPKFRLGDRVASIAGSSWRGRVVGAYATTTTQEGYVVESENGPSRVQIYSAAVLVPADAAPGTQAIADIAAERARQVGKGYTEQGDDIYTYDELALAATVYACPPKQREMLNLPAVIWPWGQHFFAPRDRRSDLVRAGTLIVAEIERLDRAAQE
ncbi:MAG: hypothetical protein JNM13_15260 [Hyphomicrobiaceae bacterium]|nr:hypothetical protein [Hyphomicrobiaceae bacterium]